MQHRLTHSDFAIVPAPRRLVGTEDVFTLKPSTLVIVDRLDDRLTCIAHELVEWIARATGFRLPICYGEDHSSDSFIRINLQPSLPDPDNGPESYWIKVGRMSASISAHTPTGLFYGLQTFRQLLSPAFERGDGMQHMLASIHGAEISDGPRFSWRGLLLDCSRHFRSKAYIRRLIDLLAYHKMNVLHWHLIDDQGWRIQIDKYPKLTEVGAWRGDKANPYGGFYTKDDIREIVAYAQKRHIMIVPEIELPGHSSAALAAYPHLSCHGRPAEVPTRWGVFKDIMCGGKNEVVQFYEDVLSEVVELFPAPYIHIGGDEAPRENWRECPHCQERIRQEKLRDEKHLQTWLTMQIQRFLEKKNRRIIGWDELYEGGMPPGAVLQHWRFEECLNGALAEGHEVIASRNVFAYFDYPHDKDPHIYSKDTQKADWMPALGIEKAYSYEPIPEDLPRDKWPLIIGGECTLWGEFIPTDDLADEHLFPRLCAFAEVMWSPKDLRNYADFQRRISVHLQRLEAMGVKYFRGPQAPATWKQIMPPASAVPASV